MLFHLANLPYWLLLAVGVLCLGLMIISGDGDEDLDIEMSLEAGSDVDITHLDVELDQGETWKRGKPCPWPCKYFPFLVWVKFR
ncbi:hypothetical protein NON20_18665 [Synechocystis sp. B12]|nr:hypothetical protein NON20_18665 [Synechocystis sp. B12]